MNRYKSQANQKCWGIGVRESKIIGTPHWLLWISYGYITQSFSWGENQLDGTKQKT